MQGEFQRYPGHPATTDLSRIFLGLSATAAMGNYPYTASTVTPGSSSGFFTLFPRYNDDYGSKGGITNTTQSNVQTPVSATTARLYSADGEMLYTPQRTASAINRQQVETGKFFLTSSSRAPEVNLFGTPRISMWPIDSDYGSNPTAANATQLATPFDKMIAFCTTTGSGAQRHPYYFQRHDSTSATNDYSQIARNQNLYQYLQYLTSRQTPGFGGSFAAKYQFSSSIERDQILTEMVDYIRCTDVYDHSVKDPASPANPLPRFTPRGNNPATGWGQVVPLKINTTRGLGRMFTLSEVGLLIICTADGNGTGPATTDWRTASNVASNTTLADTSGGSTTILPSKKKRLQAMLVFEFSSPMLGYDIMMPDIRINTSGLSSISIGGKNPFPTDSIYTETPGTRLNYSMQAGGLNGFQYFISRLDWANNYRVNGWSNASAADPAPYRFVSNPFTVDTDASGNGAIDLGSGALKVELQVKKKSNPATRETAQTFNLTFPATKIPIPDLLQYGIKYWDGSTSTWKDRAAPSSWWGFDNRIQWVGSYPASMSGSPAVAYLDQGCVIRTDPPGTTSGTPVPGWNSSITAPIPVTYYKTAAGVKPPASSMPPSDVVRTLIAKQGDVRIIMAKATVDAGGATSSDMTKHPGYDDQAYKLAHSLMEATNSNYVTGVDLGGKLVPGANYDPAWVPKIPSDATPQSDW
ncbi:MAG: hypothetical protein WCH43_13405, partial [Verrucomicrobiota bacterium]